MSEHKTERELFTEWARSTGRHDFYMLSMEAWEAWQARAAIPQAVSAEPQWIPVSERMPEPWQRVLIAYPAFGDDDGERLYAVAAFVRGQWMDTDDEEEMGAGTGFHEATHWMPLPPAPKEPQ